MAVSTLKISAVAVRNSASVSGSLESMCQSESLQFWVGLGEGGAKKRGPAARTLRVVGLRADVLGALIHHT